LKRSLAVFALAAVCLLPILALAQVLGPCGQPEAGEKTESAKMEQGVVMHRAVEPDRVPLPGERAIDFELTAVVGDEIKKIKLYDYQGMYRVVCFYPADFTFV
jgi:hypothetical protein